MNEEKPINEINIKEVITIFLSKKLFIIFFTLAFAIFSIFYSLSIPNTYTSSALLSSSNSDESLSSKLGSYSSIASFAGFSMPSSSGTDSQEAMARIKSYDFFVDEFLPNIDLANLMAVKKWTLETDEIIYDNKLFDATKNQWVRRVNYPFLPKPSKQEAYEEYLKRISISEDKLTKFVNISFEHHSPYIAQKWVDLCVNKINSYMKKIDQEIAKESIEFLEEMSLQTNIALVEDTVSILLKQQLETLMFSESSDNYVYTYIESPLAPEKKSGPSRAIICVLITLFGFFLSMLISIIIHFRMQ